MKHLWADYPVDEAFPGLDVAVDAYGYFDEEVYEHVVAPTAGVAAFAGDCGAAFVDENVLLHNMFAELGDDEAGFDEELDILVAAVSSCASRAQLDSFLDPIAAAMAAHGGLDWKQLSMELRGGAGCTKFAEPFEKAFPLLAGCLARLHRYKVARLLWKVHLLCSEDE